MNLTIYIVIAIASLAFCGWVIPKLVRAYSKYRAKMVLTCPESWTPVAVKVDLARAAVGEIVGKSDIKLTSCTRWPERQDCDQDCVLQIEVAPEDCIIKTMLSKWYADKLCAFCNTPIGKISWLGPRPALLDPHSGITVECLDVPAERLPDLLTDHRAVCPNCHVAESFRRINPALVVDRSFHQDNTWPV
jgi:hypothetical protein